MPLSPERPYRSSLRPASSGELKALNYYLGHSGAKAHKEASKELAALAADPTTHLNRLASHPDERVQLAVVDYLLSHPDIPNSEAYWHKGPMQNAGTAIRDLAARLKAQWQAEDSYAWTPIADKLATHPAAPQTIFQEALAVLKNWLAMDPVAPEILLSCQAPSVHALLAAHPAHLSPEQLQALLKLNPEFLKTVTETKGPLQKHQCATLGHIALAETLSPVYYHALRGTNALINLRRLGWTPQKDALPLLIERVAEPYNPALSSAGPRPGPPKRAHFDQLFSYLTSLDLTPQQLDLLFARANPTRHWVARLLKHPSATLAFYKHVATQSQDPSVQRILFSNPEIAQDPNFRRELANSTSPHLWAMLCLNATTEEFNFLFAKILKYAPKYIIFILENANFPPNLSIDATHFKSLLAQPKQKKRERAIKAIGRLNGYLISPVSPNKPARQL